MKLAGVAALAALSCLSACDRDARESDAGPALEQAARAAGMIGRSGPTGVFASDSDRVCLVPLPDEGYRVGASVDYGEGQRCVAHGTARAAADRDGAVAVDFGGGCRFDATLTGDRLAFPAAVPEGCERLCSGRASLATLIGDRLSDSRAEAAAARDASGEPLCAD